MNALRRKLGLKIIKSNIFKFYDLSNYIGTKEVDFKIIVYCLCSSFTGI